MLANQEKETNIYAFVYIYVHLYECMYVSVYLSSSYSANWILHSISLFLLTE